MTDLKETLEKLEETLKKVKEKERERYEKKKTAREERWRKIKEKEKEESKRFLRIVEKLERKEKKKKLEKKWAMMRWVTSYIEKNEVKWRRLTEQRKEEDRMRLEDWKKKGRLEKIKILKEKFQQEGGDTTEKERENKRERKPGCWKIVKGRRKLELEETVNLQLLEENQTMPMG